jgi:mannitol-specific phosphotransferase system IIBC component
MYICMYVCVRVYSISQIKGGARAGADPGPWTRCSVLSGPIPTILSTIVSTILSTIISTIVSTILYSHHSDSHHSDSYYSHYSHYDSDCD